MSDAFPIIIDDTLSLRVLEPSDAEALYALIDRNREYLRPWFRWAPNVKDAGEVRQRLEQELHGYEKHGTAYCGVIAESKLVGLVYLCDHDLRNNRAEIGYWLDQNEQGKGYALRASKTMVDYCFGILEVERVSVNAELNNARSRGLAERLGFTFEGERHRWSRFPDGSYQDLACYRMLREDWVSDGRGELG